MTNAELATIKDDHEHARDSVDAMDGFKLRAHGYVEVLLVEVERLLNVCREGLGYNDQSTAMRQWIDTRTQKYQDAIDGEPWPSPGEVKYAACGCSIAMSTDGKPGARLCDHGWAKWKEVESMTNRRHDKETADSLSKRLRVIRQIATDMLGLRRRSGTR